MQCTPLNVQFEEANNDSAMDLELSKWISNATTQKKKIATNLPPGVHDNDDEDFEGVSFDLFHDDKEERIS